MANCVRFFFSLKYFPRFSLNTEKMCSFGEMKRKKDIALLFLLLLHWICLFAGIWMVNIRNSMFPYIIFDMSHFHHHRMLFYASYIVPLSKQSPHEWIFWSMPDLWFAFVVTEKKVPRWFQRTSAQSFSFLFVLFGNYELFLLLVYFLVLQFAGLFFFIFTDAESKRKPSFRR